MTVFRYLVAELARGWLLAAVLLGAVISLLVLLEELKDVGNAQYGLQHALLVVSAGIPARLVTLLPFIALLGTLYAIADLGRRSELAVLQASGMSRGGIAAVVLTMAVGVAGLAIPFDEHVAAPLLRDGLAMRARLAEAERNVLGTGGFWARSGEHFVNVARFDAQTGVADGVRVFDFDGPGNLQRYAHGRAVLAEPRPSSPLIFTADDTRHYGPAKISLGGPGDLPAGRGSERLLGGISGEALGNAALPMAALAPSELAAQAARLRSLGQQGQRYMGSYWRRVLAPLAVVTLALLAIPFALGPVRGGGFAARLALGAMVGLGWYIGDQILFSVGLLADYPPLLVALVAPALAAVVAVIAMQRTMR